MVEFDQILGSNVFKANIRNPKDLEEVIGAIAREDREVVDIFLFPDFQEMEGLRSGPKHRVVFIATK